MKFIKRIFSVLLLFVMMGSFSQCASTKQLEAEAPTEFGNVYFQKWVAGVEGGGSGINLVIPVASNTMDLDSVYFRNKSVKLELANTHPKTYIGRFKTALNQKKDMVLDHDTKEAFKATEKEATKTIPFELKDHECVVSYQEGHTTKYYKITGIIEKDMIPYPSAPPNKQ